MSRLFTRCRRATRSEAGFTLTELVATVVIMGIVIAPLAMALNQAITLVPRSQARTQAAVDNDRVIGTFAGDVAQAATILTKAGWWTAPPDFPIASFLPPFSPPSVGCPASLPQADDAIAIFWRRDVAVPTTPPPRLDVTWQLRFSPGGAGSVFVELQRSTKVDSNPASPYETLLSGYCLLSEPGIVLMELVPPKSLTANPAPVDGIYDGAVAMTVRLRDRDGTARDEVRFEAKTRVTHPG